MIAYPIISTTGASYFQDLYPRMKISKSYIPALHAGHYPNPRFRDVEPKPAVPAHWTTQLFCLH
jgi:hypothetical protein